MAYIYQDPNDPNNPLNQQPGGGQPGPGQTTPAPTGGDAGLMGSGAPGAATAAGGSTASMSQPSSSGWTNLRAYLDANKDQAPGFADQLAGTITSQGDAAKNAVTGGVQSYNDQVAKSQPGDFNSVISEANADPVKFAEDPTKVSKLSDLEGGIFNGPDTFESQPGYGDMATKADAASRLPSLATSEGGQKELLKQFNPQETEGQSSLDRLLLSGVPEAASKLNAAGQPYANLRATLDQGAQAGDAARTKAMADTTAARDAAQSQFVQPQTKALDELNKGLFGRWQSNQGSTSNGQPSWPTQSSITMPKEAAKILALQKLVSGYSPFLNSTDPSWFQGLTVQQMLDQTKGTQNYF